MKPPLNDDLKLGSILMAFSLFLWLYAIPFHIKGGTQALFPNFVTIFIAVPALIMLIRGYKTAKAAVEADQGESPKIFNLSLFILLLMMMAYVFLIGLVGFYSTSFAAIIVFMLYFGIRRILPLILMPVSILAVVYLVIGKVLSFPMPEGILF